jgi:hypothetical protein
MADEKKVSGKTRAGTTAKPFPWEEAIGEQYERTKSRLKGLATEPEAELQRILEQYLPKKSDSREERMQKLEDLAMGFAGTTIGKVGNVRVKSTVKDPLRMAFPGIYQRPDVIAAEAASRVAPESPNLKAIFGVTRDDLYEMGKGRQGNLPGTLPGAAAKPRGSEAAARIMLPKNEQRIIDTLAEAEKYPELVRGMDPWYVMDPLFQRMEKLLGRERAIEEYTKFNTLMGMASPGTEVLTEIPRGTAAYYLQKQGRFPDFFEYAGVPAARRGANFPADIKNVPGHMYHTTSQALPMQRYLEAGEMQMDSPKVPLYIEASGVPEIGFQTATPVGDAHWSRSVGLADTRGKAMRKGKEVVPGASVTNPEMTMLAPWWRESIAEPLGLESVPAQARAWGTFSGQTGVTTPIGAPKLELIADKIAETARRLGVSLEKARDLVLTGEAYAGKKQGGAVGMAQGGLAQYGLRHSGEGVKGKGYFGPMAGREGTVTELSAEDESGEFPLVVPTLTAEEIELLLAGKDPTAEMMEKASSWAATRRKRGESPFASPTEVRMPRPKAEGGSVNLTDLPDEVTPANWREHLQNNVLADARALLGVKDGGVINLDELIEKSLKKKDGGVINLDELIDWTLAKAEHRKMKEGGAVKMQGGGNPGEVSGEMFKPKPLSIPEPITDLVEALRRQFEKEKRSMRKPGAVQDVLMRGPVAAYAGAPADIVGMGGELLDFVQKKIPALRKPASVMDTGPEKTPPMGYAPMFPLSPEGSYGTTAVQEMMGKAGLTTGEERPLFETGAMVAAPVAGYAGLKAGKALPSVIKPKSQEVISTTAKTLEEGVKPYATTQEGPFFRVSPASINRGSAGVKGNLEAGRESAEVATGTSRGDVSEPFAGQSFQDLTAEKNFPFEIADAYTRETSGLPYALPSMTEGSLAKQSAVGKTFELAATDAPAYKNAVFEAYKKEFPNIVEQANAKDYDDLLEKAYLQLAKETEEQFSRLPINLSYHQAGEGNYKSSAEMLHDVHRNKHLYVFQGGDPHDFLNAVDPVTGLNTNEKFRAVHDFFGHAVHGTQFGPKGEEMAWLAHSQMYSPLARLAMTSETRGQNSFVNFTPINAELKKTISSIEDELYEARRRGRDSDVQRLEQLKSALFNEFQFAPQKSVLLPPEFTSQKYQGGMPAYIQNLIEPKAGTTTKTALTHYSTSPSLTMTDPLKYGTGLAGEEARRLEDVTGAVRPRTYFYAGEPGEVIPEVGLGPYRYRSEGTSLYDLAVDPLNFRSLAAEANRIPFTASTNAGLVRQSQALADLERLIKEYGYEGYLQPGGRSPAAAVFKPKPVERRATGGRTTKADLEREYRMAFGGGVFNTDPDITDSGRIIPHNI